MILFATLFTFPIVQERTRKLFVAIRNTMQHEHCTTTSRKPKSPKETEKAELILVQQVAVKVLQCFISQGLLMKSEYFESPTIVLITDRTDLDDQLSGQFTNAKNFIGDNTVVSVESRANLRELTTRQTKWRRFSYHHSQVYRRYELLTDRTNVICISDEAHRSQVNLDQKVKVTEKGVTKTFGFAKYLHDSLPNATLLVLQERQLMQRWMCLAKVVDAYTMTESVKDEITVRIVYEGRAAKVALKNGELEKIEEYYEEAAEAGANEYQIEQSKQETANMYAILGDPIVYKLLPKIL